MLKEIRQAAQVKYRTQVINADGSAARTWSPWKRNLILNAGLDMPVLRSWVNLFAILAMGDGTTPVQRDSGTTTFTRAGNVVTASNGFFVPDDATSGGRLLNFDSGERMTITAVNSATEAIVDQAGTIAASQATIWYVNETGHGGEFARCSGLSLGVGDNVSTFLAPAWTHRCTFLSDAFSAAKVVREVGWSYDWTGALFGRDLVPGGGDPVAIGQKYKVQVELSVSYGPAASVVVGDVGDNGFNTAGTAGLEACGSNLVSQIFSNGFRAAPNGVPLEPACGALNFYISEVSAPIAAMAGGSSGNLWLGTYGPELGYCGSYKPAYIAGSHYIENIGTFDENTGNSALVRSIFWSGGYLMFRVLFDTPQVKDNLHTLTCTFRLSWDRVLVN